MTLSPASEILVVICLAVAIAVFFWSLDTVRRERATADLVISQLPRRRSRLDFRDTVDRVMQPIADLLSERNRRAGRVTLAEDLAKAGMRLTSSEYLLLQVSTAFGLGLFGLWVFGIGPQFLLLGWLGFIAPHFYMLCRQDAR